MGWRRRAKRFAGSVVLLLLPFSVEAKDPNLCLTVANTVRTLYPSRALADPWASPLNALSSTPGSGVTVDFRGVSGSEAELRARLPAEVHASPDLEKEIVERPASSLHRFGDSALYLSQTMQGTARCQGFLFFEAKRGTVAKAVEAPTSAKAGVERLGFCGKTSGHAGMIAGTPAFIAQADGENTVEITITPWADGHWQESCRLSIVFTNEFQAKEKFCESGNCEAYAERARDLAQTFDEAPNWGNGGRLTDKINADAVVSKKLPTFGRDVPGLLTDFSADSIFVPGRIGSEFLFARIGHSTLGWRTMRDYLVAFYRPGVGQLTPVAGIFVTKTRTGPGEITQLNPER
jgi:hypothetical protein